MDIQQIITELENEIAHLARIVALLKGTNGSLTPMRQTRYLSAEARKKIADAQRKRWAKARKQTKAQS